MLVSCKDDLYGLHCEGGVKNGHESLGGACMTIEKPNAGAEPAVVGTARWLSDEGMSTTDLVVRRAAARDAYTLERGGAMVATIEKNGTWLFVTFTTKPWPDARRLGAGSRVAIRSDPPGFLQ